MAARKSCTHLTWADAKSLSGGSVASKKKPQLSKNNADHGRALTAKICAKNGPSSEDKSMQKVFRRRMMKDEEKALAVAAKRKEEKELRRRERLVRPFDQAMERIAELAGRLRDGDESSGVMSESLGVMSESILRDNGDGDDEREGESPKEPPMPVPVMDSEIMDSELMSRIAECRELQCNEVLGLEAIYAGTDEFLASTASDLELLQHHIEQWQMDPGNETLQRSIVRHPPTSFTLRLTVDGTCDEHDMEFAALLLLRVTMPAMYPLDEESVPLFRIERFIATDREAVCGPDKPLQSLAYCEETRLNDLLEREARQMLPDPCVYEVVTSCLVERLFEFVRLSAHFQHKQHGKQTTSPDAK